MAAALVTLTARAGLAGGGREAWLARRRACAVTVSHGARSRGRCVEVRAASDGGRDDASASASSSPYVKGPSFDRKLEEIKRVAESKKRQKEQKAEEDASGPLNYDAEVEPSNESNSGLKIGAGVAAALLALLFVLGDISPAPESGTRGTGTSVQLSENEKIAVKIQVDKFESQLTLNPDDSTALEGFVVGYARLGQYDTAAQKLEQVIQQRPENVNARQLLAELFYSQGRYSDSAQQYKSAVEISPIPSVELLDGLVETLIADGRKADALEEAIGGKLRAESSVEGDKLPFGLLLARAFVANERADDATEVYDELILSHPDDFRPYVAKGSLLKSQGNKSAADKLFVKALYLAPQGSKQIVDQISRQ